MNAEIIYDIFFFFLVFLGVFVINYFLYLRKIKKNKLEIYEYLVKRFRLNPKKLHLRKMILPMSLINAFIIAFCTTFITMIKVDFIWQLMIGFVLVFFLIYSLYEIYGRHLVNKSRKDNENEF